jgi:hypothetical protein
MAQQRRRDHGARASRLILQNLGRIAKETRPARAHLLPVLRRLRFGSGAANNAGRALVPAADKRGPDMMNLRGLLIAAALTAASIAPVAAADQPSGEISFSGGSVAVGVGFTWANGTLHFNGHDYPFSINGVSVADVGAASIDGSGEVYNLQHVEDFSGNYVAASADVTVGGGAGAAALENQKGVRVYLHTTSVGLKINLSTDGVKFALK